MVFSGHNEGLVFGHFGLWMCEVVDIVLAAPILNVLRAMKA